MLDLNLVDTYKLYQIAFADTSRYLSNPVNPSFEITIPGYAKKNIEFIPRTVNIYDPLILGISTKATTQLPDGVYIIKYSVQPNTTNYTEKTFMRTAFIESLYKKLFLKVDNQCDCNPQYKSTLKTRLNDIEMLINGAIASVNDCDIQTGNLMYRKALSLINDTNICNC